MFLLLSNGLLLLRRSAIGFTFDSPRALPQLAGKREMRDASRR